MSVYFLSNSLAAAAVEALEAVTATLGLLQSESEVFWARTRERRLRLRSLDAAVVEGRATARRAARDALSRGGGRGHWGPTDRT